MKDILHDPAISDLISKVIYAILTVIAYGIARGLRSVWEWVLTSKYSTIGRQAYAMAESLFSGQKGASQEKMDAALNWFARYVTNHHIKFDPEKAKAAIEEGWMLYEGQYKKRPDVAAAMEALNKK